MEKWSVQRLNKELQRLGMQRSNYSRLSKAEKIELLETLTGSNADSSSANDVEMVKEVPREPSVELPFDLLMVRQPITKAELMQRDKITDINEMWKSKVSYMNTLEKLERNRYAKEIQATASVIQAEDPSGILVGLLLPQGSRIMRKWNENEMGEHVYLWCAANPEMSDVRIGTFVITHANGNVLEPNLTIGEQIPDRVELFNVRPF